MTADSTLDPKTIRKPIDFARPIEAVGPEGEVFPIISVGPWGNPEWPHKGRLNGLPVFMREGSPNILSRSAYGDTDGWTFRNALLSETDHSEASEPGVRARLVIKWHEPIEVYNLQTGGVEVADYVCWTNGDCRTIRVNGEHEVALGNGYLDKDRRVRNVVLPQVATDADGEAGNTPKTYEDGIRAALEALPPCYYTVGAHDLEAIGEERGRRDCRIALQALLPKPDKAKVLADDFQLALRAGLTFPVHGEDKVHHFARWLIHSGHINEQEIGG